MDKIFVIYYEISPMRALLNRKVVADNEENAVKRLEEQLQMKPKIRSVVEEIK